MLKYLSKTVTKAYNVSKKAILKQKQAYKQTQQYKLIRSLQKSQSQILPTTKLSQLATMSYNTQQFQLILDIILLKIDIKTIEKGSKTKLRRLRNMLNISSYLIKYGASGFIDQFRDQIELLKQLTQDNNYIDGSNKEGQNSLLRFYIQQNVNRAKYIIQLLLDKNKLIKQKQIAMLIKKKMKIGEKQKQNTMQDNNNQQEIAKRNKVQNFLQNYLWKYVGIIDDKLDQVAEVLAEKVEKYLLQQTPESFQIDQMQLNEQNKIKTQINLVQNKIKEEKKFLESKQKINGYNPNLNLLEL